MILWCLFCNWSLLVVSNHLLFSILPGEMMQIWRPHIFEMGWFNHQLGSCWLFFDQFSFCCFSHWIWKITKSKCASKDVPPIPLTEPWFRDDRRLSAFDVLSKLEIRSNCLRKTTCFYVFYFFGSTSMIQSLRLQNMFLFAEIDALSGWNLYIYI